MAVWSGVALESAGNWRIACLNGGNCGGGWAHRTPCQYKYQAWSALSECVCVCVCSCVCVCVKVVNCMACGVWCNCADTRVSNKNHTLVFVASDRWRSATKYQYTHTEMYTYIFTVYVCAWVWLAMCNFG